MVQITSTLVLMASTFAYINAAAVPLIPSPTGPLTVRATPATQSDTMQKRDHRHHGHHHHEHGYDPEHSQHWNYHHGFTDVDGPSRKDRRASLASLRRRVDANSVQHSASELLKVDMDEKHLKADLLKESLHKEEHKSSKRSHHHKSHKSHKGHKSHRKGGKLRVRSFDQEDQEVVVKRSHNHHDEGHWYNGEWYSSRRHSHSHSHSHSHNHERSVNAQAVVKRSHNDNDHDEGHWYNGEWYSHRRHGHHHHHSRSLAETGVPGFVEVASTVARTSLAKSFAGLVFTATTPDKQSNFSIGTSDQHSTQFNLVPSADQSKDAYNLKIPILDSQSLKSTDYCATFSTTPPSPLALEPCGSKDGYSQNFAYNSTTGQLSPVYHLDNSTAPAGTQSFKVAANNANASNDASTDDSDSSLVSGLNIPPLMDQLLDIGHIADTDDEEDDDSTTDAKSFQAQSNSLKSTPREETPPTADLYFVPASSYYQDAQDLDDDLEDSDMVSDSPLAASSAAAPAPAKSSPIVNAPPAAKSVAPPVAGRPIAPAAVTSRPAVPGLKPSGAVLAASASQSDVADPQSTQSVDDEDDDDMDADSDDEDSDDDVEDLVSSSSSVSATSTSTMQTFTAPTPSSTKPAAPQVNLADPCPMEMDDQ